MKETVPHTSKKRNRRKIFLRIAIVLVIVLIAFRIYLPTLVTLDSTLHITTGEKAHVKWVKELNAIGWLLMAIVLHIADWKTLFKATYKKWAKDDPFRQSAVIAYYAIFSIPALLIIVINIAGALFGNTLMSGKLSYILVQLLGVDAANQVQDTIIHASLSEHSLPATLIGIFTAMIGALGVFAELQNSFNYIWGVKPKKNIKFIEVVKSKLFSFGLLLSISFLLLISLLFTTAITALGNWISAHIFFAATILLAILDLFISFGLISLLFACMFRILPSAKTKWKYAWAGGKLTAILFILGKFAMGIYFGKFHPASAYGTAGAIVLILLWVSYSCMIVFFGAEFTKQYAKKYEGHIVPKKNALNTSLQTHK